MEEADRVERSGRRVLHLEVGQPGTKAPQRVLDAAHRALDRLHLGYTGATGIPELRERIAKHYLDHYGVTVDPRSVVATTGASAAFVLAFLAAFDKGDSVAITVPGYPCYANILRALDLVPVDLPVGPESGYQLTARHLRSLNVQPQGLILASPANPTGSMLTPHCLREILTYCRENGIFVIVDEIYHRLVFGDTEEATAAEFVDSVIVINSFSKYYSMTGWRLGWMIVPESLLRSVEILSQNLAICPPTLSQHAALEAFECDEELRLHVESYRRNRAVLLSALKTAGVTDIAPAEGAFYIYADMSAFTHDSVTLCSELLEKTGVAATPGVDFDPIRGSTSVRFSYCRNEEDVLEASLRLRDFLLARQPG